MVVRRRKMSVRIKALDADIQDPVMTEREMQSYIEEREVAGWEAAWKTELSRRKAEIARQEARLKVDRENLEKEKSLLMGTASNQDNQDGALENPRIASIIKQLGRPSCRCPLAPNNKPEISVGTAITTSTTRR
ncbi:uncharacterized protein LOC124678021 [Lolium rigidum]|uniref:uncharacterized protein LOC124669633 n=1 Tax=Lolium rigidum TaxID=89674 RepID=UPI001F5C4E6E|nr:uncharacterized protein LOC124669633 [Lolium rigidum]XP_047069919.1 uncharacterized protein LOC124678021 [Lolium rigidum]